MKIQETLMLIYMEKPAYMGIYILCILSFTFQIHFFYQEYIAAAGGAKSKRLNFKQFLMQFNFFFLPPSSVVFSLINLPL